MANLQSPQMQAHPEHAAKWMKQAEMVKAELVQLKHTAAGDAPSTNPSMPSMQEPNVNSGEAAQASSGVALGVVELESMKAAAMAEAQDAMQKGDNAAAKAALDKAEGIKAQLNIQQSQTFQANRLADTDRKGDSDAFQRMANAFFQHGNEDGARKAIAQGLAADPHHVGLRQLAEQHGISVPAEEAPPPYTAGATEAGSAQAQAPPPPTPAIVKVPPLTHEEQLAFKKLQAQLKASANANVQLMKKFEEQQQKIAHDEAMQYYKQDKQSMAVLSGYMPQYKRTKRLPTYTTERRAYTTETKFDNINQRHVEVEIVKVELTSSSISSW